MTQDNVVTTGGNHTCGC